MLEDWILFFIRIILGITMIYYGVRKLKDLKANASSFDEMGFKPGIFWGTIVAFSEFFSSLALILGVLARVGAVLIGFQMILGTIWKIKTGKEFSNYSYDLLIIAICAVIIAFGSGAYAIFALSLG